MNNTKTGQFISSRRKELGFTQNQLAEKLNVTDKAISKWENGKSAPDIATLLPLAEVLEVSVVEILNGKRMEQVEMQAESDFAIVDTMKKSKKKIVCSVIAAVVLVLLLISLIPAYHYFSSISINDTDALAKKAYEDCGINFENVEENAVLKTVKTGDYLVLLIENNSYMTDVVFRRNEMFRDRYEICLSGSGESKGKIGVSAFGEDGKAINILYGVDLPDNYTKYSFRYRSYQYICPIEDGIVLDVFVDESGSFTNASHIELLE